MEPSPRPTSNRPRVSDDTANSSGGLSQSTSYPPARPATTDLGRPAPRDSLVDVLERVLDKGVVIAGDISIRLLDIELLTIKLRLLIASVDKAKEMGIDWWTRDPQLSGSKGSQSAGPAAITSGNDDRARLLDDESQQLREKIRQLEAKEPGDDAVSNRRGQKRASKSKRKSRVS
jgi:hypothetical protein